MNPDAERINKIDLSNGGVRYEIIIDAGKRDGKRRQVRRRFRTELEAKEFLDGIKGKLRTNGIGTRTDSEIVNALNRAFSLHGALKILEVAPSAHGYRALKRIIRNHKVDTSHFTRVHVPGVSRRNISDYLNNGAEIASHKLRLRLIDEGIFAHICDECGNTKWLGKPVPLELEHIDGNHRNNKLENLRLLCPNCHAQTSTYRGKNIGKIV